MGVSCAAGGLAPIERGGGRNALASGETKKEPANGEGTEKAPPFEEASLIIH